MNARRVLAALLVALVLLGTALLAWQLEPYEETVDRGPSPEARANPYLAAQRFLEQRHINVRAADTWTELPVAADTRQTLLLFDERSAMTPQQADALLAWAEHGGHLVFVAEHLWNEHLGRSGDLLLDRLHIHQYRTADLPPANTQAPNSPLPVPMARPSPKRERGPQLTRLYLENEDSPAYMSFDPAYHLEDPEDHAQYWANSANATHMLQLQHGQGLVTIVTDAELWKNNAIDRYDNAWLLWYLTQDSTVTLVARARHDNLLTLLVRYFPLALTTLAVLLVLALWRAAMREGPLQTLPASGRRQLTEHLRAAADFLLRQNGQQVLLRHLQRDVLRRARQRHPGFEGLGVTEQWQILARLTRQPTRTISLALRPPSPQRLSKAEFTRQVAHLQTIRNAL